MIDPNEAPEGYVAVGICESCAFWSDLDACREARCLPHEREDGENVMFVKRKENK